MKNTTPIVRRQSLAATSSHAPTTVDQAVIDAYVKLQDPEPVVFVKPTMEEYLEQRHKLKPENYSPDLLWIIETLKEYVNVMKTGGNSTQTEHGIQVGRLSLAYNRALRSTDVVIMFDTILWFFSFYNDNVFRAELPFRGTHMHKFGSVEQHHFFTHITSIAQQLADIQTRHQRLRELDFRGAIQNVPKSFEKQKAGLTTFIDYYTNF